MSNVSLEDYKDSVKCNILFIDAALTSTPFFKQLLTENTKKKKPKIIITVNNIYQFQGNYMEWLLNENITGILPKSVDQSQLDTFISNIFDNKIKMDFSSFNSQKSNELKIHDYLTNKYIRFQLNNQLTFI